MAGWPTLADLQDQLQTAALTGAKATVAQSALDAATEWISERCGLWRHDVQRIALGSTVTSWTLTYAGQTTTALASTDSAAVVQAALEALSNIGAGNVTVTGLPGGPYTATFAGTLGTQDVAQMTASTGVTVSTVEHGAATIPAPVHQAILLYAAKIYRRKDSPDGVAGTSENGLIRTGRYDSDAEQLLGPYTLFTIG